MTDEQRAQVARDAETTGYKSTGERFKLVERMLADRHEQARTFRGRAIGATVSDARWLLAEARVCEAIAVGMERALAMLWP